MAGLSHPVFTFSLADRTADCYARDVAFFDGCASFDVMIHGELYAHVDLHIPGKHNILNALAAASAAYVLGIPGQAVTLGLEDFHGPDAGSSTREAITGRRCMTTMPTTRRSSTPC